MTRTLHADLVIQSTGLETNVQHTTHPLVRHLLNNAQADPDPLGLGLCADRDGHLQHAGESWPHLFALGSLLRGTLWESTAMPEIRLQARHLADRCWQAELAAVQTSIVSKAVHIRHRGCVLESCAKISALPKPALQPPRVAQQPTQVHAQRDAKQLGKHAQAHGIGVMHQRQFGLEQH